MYDTHIYNKRFPVPVYRTILPSGAEIWTAPLPSRMATFQVAFPSGAMEDGQHKGIAHFLEHVMLLGENGRHPLLKKLMKEGVNSGASTRRWSMEFWATGFTDLFDSMISALLEVLQRPAFTKDEVERERLVILSEIDDFKASERWKRWFYARAYPAAVELQVPVCGIPSSIAKIFEPDLKSHAQAHLKFAQAVFVASGGITHRQHVEDVLKYGPDLLHPTVQGPRLPVELEYQPPWGAFSSADQMIEFFFKKPSDKRDAQAFSFGVDCLVASNYGDLFEALRSEERLVYQLSARANTKPLSDFSLVIPAKSDKFGRVKDIVEKVIRHVAKDGVRSESFERNQLGRRIYFATRQEALSRSTMVDVITRAWLENEGLQDTDLEFESLSLTPAEVQQACALYLDPDVWGIVTHELEAKKLSHRVPAYAGTRFVCRLDVLLWNFISSLTISVPPRILAPFCVPPIPSASPKFGLWDIRQHLNI